MDYRVISYSSESDDDSETYSDNDELIDIEDDGAGPAMVVRGAEPYRYEPPAPDGPPGRRCWPRCRGTRGTEHSVGKYRLVSFILKTSWKDFTLIPSPTNLRN